MLQKYKNNSEKITFPLFLHCLFATQAFYLKGGWGIIGEKGLSLRHECKDT